MRTFAGASTFKPIGLTLAAVVAGVGPGGGVPEMAQPADLTVDPSQDPRAGEDPTLILGPSTPTEPFAAPTVRQTDLFDL